ncbi:MAG: hypothetical protein KIT73_14625, partial [Burkholderiales bacterium]|nr:hypothetical protein [Burkholderiales bacterium]
TFRMLEALGGDLEDATAARQAFMARPVTAPEGADRDAHLREATDKLAQGRRAFGLAGVFFNAEAKHRLASLEVEGQAPSGADAWKHVSDYLAYQQRWRALALRWNAMAPEFGFTVLATDDPEQGTQAAAQYARYRSVRALAEAETVLERETLALFPTWTRARRVADDGQALSSLETALQRYLDTYGLSEFWSARELLERRLAGCSGPVVSRIRRFLGERLGRQSVDESAFLAEWSTLMAEVGRVRSLGPALETVVRVAAAIERSGAPELARLLRNPGPLHDRLLPAPDQWPMAWRLRRLDTYLSAVNVQAEFQRLGFLRAELEHDLARHYQEFAVTRTWLEMARNTSPAIRAALQAYLNAIQRLGKGTGKRAARYRRDAREAAVEAQRAIPCWIMPHHRVSETLPAQLGAFDLVIIDEASQSDLTALPALLRARKLLVVGDDRQVSPEGIGLEEKRIVQLMERHLADQVPLYRAQLSPDRSLYDLARVVFAGAGIMLKEHFRSVAPIVEYSKREFYGHQLQPLRLPKANERLDPPLVDIHIPEGERHGDTNPAEIDAIVGEIGRLIADPQMADRTIGVVSLLGDEQALRIWERLLERHPPELLRRHAVTCGDARTFQGRERDIIFLSMVVAPNTAIAPLTRDVFLQRFNVAASRARDRMVLVRSVEPFQLSESDRLRRGLIAHFMQPFAEAAPVTDPRDQCESPLERALYDWLVMKGYRVQPQVRLGSFGIDLVVEGSNGARLAIACDGDRGEDPALWLQDLRRQRTLERVGWVFWRCFASVWACRPESVLRSLEAVLRTHAVEPGESGGALSASLVEHRVVRRNPGADPTVDRAAVIARGSPVLRPVPSGAPTTASGAASSPVPGLVLVPSPSPLAPST